jgi:magnesium transporter
MQVVSLWSNGLGALLTLSSAKIKLDPAMTSAPLVTTIVDTTGLVLYFIIAKQ